MRYETQIKAVPAQPLLVIRSRANAGNIATVIRQLLPEIWEFVAAHDLSRAGQNVVLYHGEDGCTFDSAQGIPVEIGVQVAVAVATTARVELSAPPAGRVASTFHRGSYLHLSQTHAAVRAWCDAGGHELHGTNWEIYGHPTQNDDELETEVCYLLK